MRSWLRTELEEEAWRSLVYYRQREHGLARAGVHPRHFEWITLVDGEWCHSAEELLGALHRREGRRIVLSEFMPGLRLHRLRTEAVPVEPRVEVKVNNTRQSDLSVDSFRRGLAEDYPKGLVYPKLTPLRNDIPRRQPGSSYRNPRSVDWSDDVPRADDLLAVPGTSPQVPERPDPCDCRRPAPEQGDLQDANGRWYVCAGCRGAVTQKQVVDLKLVPRPAPEGHGSMFGHCLPPGAARGAAS
jgi:hypothetical protein